MGDLFTQIKVQSSTSNWDTGDTLLLISTPQPKKSLESPVKKFSLDMEKVKQFDAMVDDAGAEVVEVSLNNSAGARYVEKACL